MKKILIVEDDKEINKLLSDFLKENDYETISLFDGLKAADVIKEKAVDLVILDLMLPYKSGDMVLTDIRKFSNIPVIIVSAKETTRNKIDLLRLGADDYMTKPFDLEEVLARIESTLRRAGAFPDAEAVLQHNGLCIDIHNNKATLDETELSLTAKEFAILQLLLEHPEKVFSKANLFESVWGEEYITEDNALNVHISNLRAKLKKICPEKEFIDTVWGIGFRLHKD
ncbi:MAG: response regulator transcription factor [Lachnospiraceae bacterium]|jgi:DNA-binding response OmpR family regulator|nr:response regulator transcription factor [Lachnospiraceae bacterium]